jgi:hypothetical protein
VAGRQSVTRERYSRRPDYQDSGPTACETRWTKNLASIERHRDAIIAGHPDAKDETGLVHTALIAIVQPVHTSPSVNGNGAVWMKLADWLCKALNAGLQHLKAEVHRQRRRCDFSVVFPGLRANADLVTKFHVAPYAWITVFFCIPILLAI